MAAMAIADERENAAEDAADGPQPGLQWRGECPDVACF